jgi:hypothetical protein
MNVFAKIALTLATVGSCVAASAQTWDRQADEERRARNREEAIAAWEHQRDRNTNASYDDRDARYRDHDMHHKSARERTHEGASKTRSFTHRQLNKLRRFSDRQDARFHGPDRPVREDDKRPSAMGSNK